VKSLWNDVEAAQFSGPLGPRVYTSRLLGRDKSLVLHGGGNTSVKLRDKDLFDSAKYPTARFVTSAFTRKAAGQYEATGKLTIRDVTHEIHLPFTFQTAQEGGKAVAWLKGGVTVNRLDYGVGQGDWKDTSVVANEVRVKFELRLLPK